MGASGGCITVVALMDKGGGAHTPCASVISRRSWCRQRNGESFFVPSSCLTYGIILSSHFSYNTIVKRSSTLNFDENYSFLQTDLHLKNLPTISLDERKYSCCVRLNLIFFNLFFFHIILDCSEGPCTNNIFKCFFHFYWILTVSYIFNGYIFGYSLFRRQMKASLNRKSLLPPRENDVN